MIKNIFLFITLFFSIVSTSQAVETETIETYTVKETNAFENVLSFLNNIDISTVKTFNESTLNKYLIDNNIKIDYSSSLSIKQINILSTKSFAEVKIQLQNPPTTDFVSELVFSSMSKYKVRQASSNTEYLVYLPFVDTSFNDVKIELNEDTISSIEQDVAIDDDASSLLDIVEASCSYGFTKLVETFYCKQTFSKNQFNTFDFKVKECPKFMYYKLDNPEDPKSNGKCIPNFSYTSLDNSNNGKCSEGFIFESNTKKCFSKISELTKENINTLYENPTCAESGFSFDTDSNSCEYINIENSHRPISTVVTKEYPAIYKTKDSDSWEDPNELVTNPEDSAYTLCDEGYVLEGTNCVKSEFACEEGGTLIDDLFCSNPVTKKKCEPNQVLNGDVCNNFVYYKQCLVGDTRISNEECEREETIQFCDNDGSSFISTTNPTQKSDTYLKPTILDNNKLNNSTGIFSTTGGTGSLSTLSNIITGEVPFGITYNNLVSVTGVVIGQPLPIDYPQSGYVNGTTFNNLKITSSCVDLSNCIDEYYTFTWDSFEQSFNVCPTDFEWDNVKKTCVKPVVCSEGFRKFENNCIPDITIQPGYTEIVVDGKIKWQPDDGSEPIDPFFTEEFLICPKGYEENKDGKCQKKMYIDKIDKDFFVESGIKEIGDLDNNGTCEEDAHGTEVCITSSKWVEIFIDGSLSEPTPSVESNIIWDTNEITSIETNEFTNIDGELNLPSEYLDPDLNWLYKKECTQEQLDNPKCPEGYTQIEPTNEGDPSCQKVENMEYYTEYPQGKSPNQEIIYYCEDGWTDTGVDCSLTTTIYPTDYECNISRSRTETRSVCPEEDPGTEPWQSDPLQLGVCFKYTYTEKLSPFDFYCNDGLTFNPLKNVCESISLSSTPTITQWDHNNPIELSGNQTIRCKATAEYIKKPSTGMFINIMYPLKSIHSNYINRLLLPLQSKNNYSLDPGISGTWKYNKFLSLEEWPTINQSISNEDLLDAVIVWDHNEVGIIKKVTITDSTPRIYHEACEAEVWTCEVGFVLDGDRCVPEDRIIEKPVCSDENLVFTDFGSCGSPDLVQCPIGYSFKNGTCESTFFKEDAILTNGVCKVNKALFACPESLSEDVDNTCSGSLPAIDWISLANNVEDPSKYHNKFTQLDGDFQIIFALYSNNISNDLQLLLVQNEYSTNEETGELIKDPYYDRIISALYHNRSGLVLSDEVKNILETKMDLISNSFDLTTTYKSYEVSISRDVSEGIGFFEASSEPKIIKYLVPTFMRVENVTPISYIGFDFTDAFKKVIDDYSILNTDATITQLNAEDEPVPTCKLNYKVVEITPNEKVETITTEEVVNEDGTISTIEKTTITWIPGEFNCILDLDYKCLNDVDTFDDLTKFCTSNIETLVCNEGFQLQNNTCVTGSIVYSNDFLCRESWFSHNFICKKSSPKVCDVSNDWIAEDENSDDNGQCIKTQNNCPNGWNKEGTACKKVYDTCTFDTSGNINCPLGYTNEGDRCVKKTYEDFVEGKCNQEEGFVLNTDIIETSDWPCVKEEIVCSGFSEGPFKCGGEVISNTGGKNNQCVKTYIDILLPHVQDKFVNPIQVEEIIASQKAEPAKYELIEDRCNTANGEHSFSYVGENPEGTECEYRDVQSEPTVDFYSCGEDEGLLYGDNLDLCRKIRERELSCEAGFSFVPVLHLCVKNNVSFEGPVQELYKDLQCGSDKFTPYGDIWKVQGRFFSKEGIKPTLDIVVNHQLNGEFKLPIYDDINELISAHISRLSGKAEALINHDQCQNTMIFQTDYKISHAPICPEIIGSRGILRQTTYNRDKLLCDYDDIVPAIHQKICRTMDKIKSEPLTTYITPENLTNSWLTNEPMIVKWENIRKIDEDTCKYDISYYDAPKSCSQLDYCSTNEPNQTNCIKLDSKPIDANMFEINPSDEGQCIHKWKNCGVDLSLPKDTLIDGTKVKLDLSWSFDKDNENLCTIDFIKRDTYEYCNENQTYYPTPEQSKKIKPDSSDTDITNAPESEFNIVLENAKTTPIEYINILEQKIYRTKVINYTWNIEPTVITQIIDDDVRTHSKNRTLISQIGSKDALEIKNGVLITNYDGLGDASNNPHYFGGWINNEGTGDPLVKKMCDTHESRYTCQEGYVLSGSGCDDSNNDDGFVTRLEDNYFSPEYGTDDSTTSICRCTKEVEEGTESLLCPEGYSLNIELGTCVINK